MEFYEHGDTEVLCRRISRQKDFFAVHFVFLNVARISILQLLSYKMTNALRCCYYSAIGLF
jgi:hypothetical protein